MKIVQTLFLYFWWPSQKIWTLLQLMESNQGKSPTVQGHWKRSEFSMVYYRLRTLALKAQDDCWRRVSEDNQSYISQVFKKNPAYSVQGPLHLKIFVCLSQDIPPYPLTSWQESGTLFHDYEMPLGAIHKRRRNILRGDVFYGRPPTLGVPRALSQKWAKEIPRWITIASLLKPNPIEHHV